MGGTSLRSRIIGVLTTLDSESLSRHLWTALRVSYVSVGWGLVIGGLSVAEGIGAGSTALVGTGTDILADMVSSIVLVWRFRLELHGGRPGHDAEHRAHLVAACALLLVAIGVSAGAVAGLVSGQGAAVTAPGIAVATASVLVLPVVAAVKLRAAAALPSRALRTDAAMTVVGAVTAALSLAGLLLTHTLGWTAADPIAALGIAAIAGVTGLREMLTR